MSSGTAAQPGELLRAGLLEGLSVVLAGVGQDLAGQDALATLGARLAVCPLDPDGARELDEAAREESAAEAAVAAALATLGGPAGMLVVDAASLFSAAGAGRDALMWSMQASWAVTRAFANAALLPGGGGEGGRIALLAPPAGGHGHAGAVAAGLENLARTLATEWARYGVTIVAVTPGEQTSRGELGTVLGYLASPAGSYFSGCLIDLRGPG